MAVATTMAFISCEDHEILYQNISTSVEGSAFIQVFYFVPVTATSSNYVYKIGINGIDYVNDGAEMITTYSIAPYYSSSYPGKYYTVDPGTVNLKLYISSDMELAYDVDFELEAGYWNVCVYDFNADPVIFETGYPFEGNSTYDTDTVSHVMFVNFMWEDDDSYCEQKILYQYRWIDDDDNYTEWRNVGDYIGFAENTGWQELIVYKTTYNSSGSRKLYFRLLDEDGEVLQKWNSKGVLTNYSDYWTHYIGRYSYHVLAGKRCGTPIASERNFYAL